MRLTKFIGIISLFFLAGLPARAQQKHLFSLSANDFLLDGKPFQIISGEMHPARIPYAYWRQRIQMAKAMGCNTIAIYVFWNYQETAPGVWDFKNGNHNIAEFIKICQEEKMWVLFRPGPYVCGEWDFGGLPFWLLKTPDIKIRCMDPRYMHEVEIYVQHISKEIKPFLVTNGGPILMVQVENEYGSYGNDKTYLQTLKKLWTDNGINVPFYTADGATAFMLDAGTVEGAAIGLDSGSDEDDFAEAKKANPNVPSFSSETYPGWLTHWGEQWARPDTNDLKKEVTFLLKNKKSFNFYVIHGGTNFGFWAGANGGGKTYQADITSYDYDAPINEQGNPTAKYWMIRNLIQEYNGTHLPDIPAAIPTIEIPAITLQPFTSIWNELPKPVLLPQPKPIEYFNQQSGLILYKTTLIGNKSGKLRISEPHDLAFVFLNDQFIDTIYRDGGRWEINIPKSDVKNPVLEILVEAMGRINFGSDMTDRKGITDRVTLNGMTLMNWETYSLPLDEPFIKSLKSANKLADRNGTFFKADFELDHVGDTYLDMQHFQKGVVWVNGHNLGRYWNIGPQQRLYCPAPWLKKGKNEVIVLDLFTSAPAEISGKKEPE
ncbi:MAG: beta-galactosidase [Bacteroidetes bacterium]|nr:beta-galactosidase [Bacteroidota bacterium]